MKFTQFFLLFIIASPGLNGQIISKYVGEIELNDDVYYAEFDYFKEQGDTVYHGDFMIERPMTGYDVTEPFKFLTIDGRFDKSRADKRWNLRTGEFEAHENRRYEGYRYHLNVKGSELVAEAEYYKGEKTGAWTVYEWEVDDSSVTDTLLSMEISFDRDGMSGPFRFKDVSRLLEGITDGAGFADGEWRFYTISKNREQVLSESWRFENKQLLEVEHFSGSDAYRFEFRSDTASEGEFKEVELDQTFFEIVDILLVTTDSAAHSEFDEKPDVSVFYLEIRDKFREVDDRLFSVVDMGISLPVKVMLYQVPFSRKERRTLDKLKSVAEDLDERLNLISEDPQINLARIATPEVVWYSGVLNVIDSKYIKPLARMVALYENGNLEYVDRNRYVLDVFEFSNELRGEAVKKDTVFPVEYNFSDIVPDTDDEPLVRLESFMASLNDEITAINDSLNFYIFEVRQEKELSEKEAELYEKYESLVQLADSLLEEEHDRLAGFDLSEAIEDFLKGQVRNYAETQSAEKRSEKAIRLLSCLDQTEVLINILVGTPEKFYTTRDGYRRQVFNPYTYTYMEETMKSPIFKAFEKVLVPGLFENLKSLDCENINDYRKNFETVFESMVNLREKDTRRMERKVKRVGDPAGVAEVLEFDLKFN